MASETASAVRQSPRGLFGKVADSGPAVRGRGHDAEARFHQEWTELACDVRELRESTKARERLTRENVDRALELSLSFPDSVDVSSKPHDRRVSSIADHVQSHFDSLFNDSRFAPAYSAPSESNVRALRRAGTVVYLDDAVLRFAPVWEFEPVFEDLRPLRFTELPSECAEWMERTQLLWDALDGAVDLSKGETTGLIDTLYSSRSGFVETAIERDLFLPVPPESYEPDDRTEQIHTRFRRGHEIPPEDVHRAVYSQVLSEF